MTYVRPPDLATWPLWKRQRWGELANKLEAAGLTWQDAERKAYEQTRDLMADKKAAVVK